MNPIFNRYLLVVAKVAVLAPLIVGFAVTSSELSAQAETTPVPGTTATSATALTPATSPTPKSQVAKTSDSTVAQGVDVDPGQPTRGGSSYIGVAGNFGLGGDSAIGETSFTVISKIGFTNAISARPSIAINDDPVILIPLTYDFSLQSADAFAETIPLAPYVGAGVAIETSDDADVGFLLTGGVDYPINSQFTATAAINAAFLNDTDVGLLVGIGYNFSGL